MSEVVVEFGASQSIGALREAAYRLIGEASCLIDTGDEGRYVCRLIPKKAPGGEADKDAIRLRFLDLVTDENLRAQGVTVLASRKPTLSFRPPGATSSRLAARTYRGSPFQEPPRTTRVAQSVIV